MAVRLALVVTFVASLLAAAALQRPRPLRFADDVKSAVQDARERGELVVVHLRNPARPACAAMDAETLADPQLGVLARAGFVHVRVDAAREPDFAQRLGGPGAALVTCVLDGDGELVARRPGFATTVELGEFLAHARARAAAVARARARLRDHPQDERAQVELAALELELGCTESAEEHLDAAIARTATIVDASRAASSGGNDPDFDVAVRARALHARLLAERGEAAGARSAFEEWRALAGLEPRDRNACEVDPDSSAEALLTEARILALERRERDAAALLDRMIDRYAAAPATAGARRLRARLAAAP